MKFSRITVNTFGRKLEYCIKQKSSQENFINVQGILPLNPNSLAALIKLLPLSLFSFETIVSAGWDTMAQNTPAKRVKAKQLLNSIFNALGNDI